MIIRVVGALVALVMSAGVVQAQDRPPVLENASQCLRERAAEAVAASSGAADAADFLLNYLCARPVTAAARFRYNTALVDSMQGMGAMLGDDGDEFADDSDEANLDDEGEDADSASIFREAWNLSVDQTTGEIVGFGSAGMVLGALRVQGLAMEGLYLQPSAELRALAGSLVLEARRPR